MQRLYNYIKIRIILLSKSKTLTSPTLFYLQLKSRIKFQLAFRFTIGADQPPAFCFTGFAFVNRSVICFI